MTDRLSLGGAISFSFFSFFLFLLFIGFLFFCFLFFYLQNENDTVVEMESPVVSAFNILLEKKYIYIYIYIFFTYLK